MSFISKSISPAELIPPPHGELGCSCEHCMAVDRSAASDKLHRNTGDSAS